MGRTWRYDRYTYALVLAILLTVVSVGRSSRMLLGVGRTNITDDSTDTLHRRPDIANPPPRVFVDGGESDAAVGPGTLVKTPSKDGDPPIKKAGETDATPWLWENAGGKFGLSSNWHEAVLVSDGGEGEATMRGGQCMTAEKQEQVRGILERRGRIPLDEKVRQGFAVYGGMFWCGLLLWDGIFWGGGGG